MKYFVVAVPEHEADEFVGSIDFMLGAKAKQVVLDCEFDEAERVTT